MLKSISIFKYFIEFIVIVLGVSASFWVEEYRENLQNKQERLKVLNNLVDKGNTVITIEHNMDIIKSSDWIIDMGPEGGDNGGEIVACGSPQQIIKKRNSVTGKYLKNYVN